MSTLPHLAYLISDYDLTEDIRITAMREWMSSTPFIPDKKLIQIVTRGAYRI